MDIGWTHAAPSVLAAFLASLVECVEALTIVLAVGSVRGWRSAPGGSCVALVVLLAIVAVLGPALARIPLHIIQIAVGALLLLFGLRWLRKSILRAVGVIPPHDEVAAFTKETARLRGRRHGELVMRWLAPILREIFGLFEMLACPAAGALPQPIRVFAQKIAADTVPGNGGSAVAILNKLLATLRFARSAKPPNSLAETGSPQPRNSAKW